MTEIFCTKGLKTLKTSSGSFDPEWLFENMGPGDWQLYDPSEISLLC